MNILARLLAAIAIIAGLSIPARPTLGAAAGPATLVKDINPNIDPTPSAPISDLSSVGDTLYFAAGDEKHGVELWKLGADGRATMIKDIYPGTPNGLNTAMEWDQPCQCLLGARDGVLYFEANDGVHGPELWRSDGTAAGTSMVKDIFVGGGEQGIYSLTQLDGVLYFSANSAGGGRELWRSDGTAAGTSLVKDINPGPGPALQGGLLLLNGSLFFWADDGSHGVELWRSDGSAAGTSMVTDITPDGQAAATADPLHRVGSRLLFTRSTPEHGLELWQTDGTAAGTNLVKDIAAGPAGSQINLHWAQVAGEILYFSANDGSHGPELWRSDGTEAGTFMLTDVQRADDNIWVYDLTAAGDGVYFHTRISGAAPLSWIAQLWHSDGSVAGTSMVTDTFGDTGQVFLEDFTAIGDRLYFTFERGTAQGQMITRLWQSDGTAAGTAAFAPTEALGIDEITNVKMHGGRLHFSGRTAASGNELWSSDGTVAGTAVIEIGRQPLSSSIQRVVTIGGVAYFSADDGIHGRELWRSDGTEAGTSMVLDLNPGAAAGVGAHLHVLSDTLYFAANDGVKGPALWRSDGTEAGTVHVKAVTPSATGSLEGTAFATVKGAFYFFAAGAGGAQELWRSDGTDAGTFRVATINASAQDPLPGSLTAAGAGVFFTASDGVHGMELWHSDGTEAGTRMVKDIVPGAANSMAFQLTALGNLVIFTTYVSDGTYRYQLWRSDGSEDGTFMLKDRFYVGAAGMAAMNGALYIGASEETPISNDKLWRTDGSVAGTVPVSNQNLHVQSMAVIGDVLYFSSNNTYRLWRTDGTAGGTRLVSTANARRLSSIDNRLYFMGWDAQHGYELWRSNGTAAGTALVQDIAPGFDSSYASYGTRVGGRLLFMADDMTHGSEPWSLALEPDTAPPVIVAPASINETTGDAAGLTITYAATASDAYDAAPTLSCAPPSGSRFPVGQTLVTCTASDIAGNTASATFTVTVALNQAPDTTPPTISVPNAISVETSDPAGATVGYEATATDAVDPSPSLSCQPPAGSRFPIGPTQVTCTASDASGNSVSAAFTVTVTLRQRLYLPLLSR